MKNLFKAMFLCAAAAAVLVSCNTPKPVQTIENLKAAITGESNAQKKYAAFAQKAAAEGYHNISKMFTAASQAEGVHIKNHVAVLEKLGETFTPELTEPVVDSTAANLQAAIRGEVYEATEMYPGFVTTAEAEKASAAVTSFSWALEAEKKHAALYTEALNILKETGSDENVSAEWYVCPKCGDLYNGIAGIENCEICGTASGQFIVFK